MKHIMEIMAATTPTSNNHNQKELRLYAPTEQQPSTTVATNLATGARSPFQREVREWQRIDPDTGALLTGRLEADRWINGPLNKYGKISDSQNISQPNGTQQTQRKQLEVLQTRTAAGGAMQVIRSQKVQTTSSRWSTSSASASPLLLSASTSPIPQLQAAPIPNHNKHNNTNNHSNIKKTTTHNSYNTNTNTTTSSTSPFMTSTLLTNGFHQQQQQKQMQFPHSLVNGSSGRNRNWPDITENMSTLDICDNDHDNEHDHDNDYIVKHSSDDDDNDDDADDDNNIDNDSLIDDLHDNVDIIDNDHHDDDDHHHYHKQYLVNERNNFKNQSNDNFTKRHSFTVLANNKSHNNNTDHATTNNNNNNNTTTSSSNHHDHHLYNLSRDSSSGSCSNSNQLFLLDTAPSLKLSNLMKSSSSLSNSSNNSTTASQATAPANPTNSSSLSLSSSMNTHKSMANKISLHAIVGNNNNNHNSYNTTTTTTSSTPSPTSSTTTRPSWQQPTIYRQNSQNNNNNTHSSSSSSNHTNHQSHNKNYNQTSNSHLMTTTRVGDNNCCSGSSSGDEARSYGLNTQAADLRHLQHQPAQQIHLKQNDRLTPTHSPLYNNRVDLESFRHYNTNNDDAYNNNNNSNAHDDDDGLRLSSRHLRRQQIPTHPPVTALQRSRSISTDDLSTEWDTQGGDTEEPSEWRRVSKLRRSFQSSSSQKSQESYNSPTSARRPLDLPSNSVSVSKIRAELENSRRLNTVMKNNHVDLAALSSILNGSPDKPETKSPLMPQRSAVLTAESLKEIRGRLKKLSDESLYKDDFVINQQHPETIHEVQHIVNDHKHNSNKSSDINREEPINKHTTHSLESRVKYKDTNSSDWHLRRKSYGFEKMSPPEKAMLRMDASTDSGLGRSGELQNWSPTSEANLHNRTVVHFRETNKVNTPNVQRRFRPQKSYEEAEHSPEEDMGASKRHSIAVDESQYVRDNSRQTTQIHLNGFYEPGNYSKLIHSTESTTTTDFLNRGQQKRVEFSKTEVHFATESGRVNIVETDSKPPPTNNFRRRRSRSTSVGPLQSLVKSATTVSTTNSVSSLASTTTSLTSTVPSGVAMPITLFGDDSSKKKPLASTTVAYRAPLMESPEPKEAGINVTVSIPHHHESYGYSESSRSSYASTSGVDTTDCDTDEMTSLRGILKNKPAKPKPYVLGENIEKPDDLWGVQLKPILSKNDNNTRDSPPLLSSGQQKTVAERIQELGTAASSQANGFSTKINVSLGAATATATQSSNKHWEETDLPTSNVMSIKLHSPQVTTEMPAPLKLVPPVAKPRTITSIQETQKPKVHTATTVKQAPFQTSLPTKDSLKIIKEARGARQLRTHELSYFGVPVSAPDNDKPKSKYNTTNANFRNSPKRSLPMRKLSEESCTTLEEEKRAQWQLDHDKPDLLKHSPIVKATKEEEQQQNKRREIKPAERTSLKKKTELNEEDQHLYENIANEITPTFKVKACAGPDQYDRKMDLKRDAMILSEMNKNADQTLRDISDEAALKDRRRRSSQRRNSKPLETIDEKAITERINDTCIAVKVSRSTYASEAKKTSRHSTPSPTGLNKPRERTSSQSSVECCPRARSRSLSSEKEYENIQMKPSRSSQMVKHKAQKPTESRSSSLDSQKSAHSQFSSGDEQQLQQQQQRAGGSFRREDRSRTKTKRITNSTSTALRDKHREDKPKSRQSSSSAHHQQQQHGDSKRLSSTTHSSTHRERVECKQDNTAGSTAQPRQHHATSSGLQRSTTVTSSGRRLKDEPRDSQRIKRSSTTASGRSTTERHDSREHSSSKQAARSVRNDDERNSSQRSSAHRLERTDKDKERPSKSSKGHSSRSTSHHQHERTTTTTTNPEKLVTSKDSKTKSANTDNTTHSKNAQHHHRHQSKDRHDGKHHRSKRDEESTEHVHGLKSAFIKTTTKLREKSRTKKEKK